MRTIRKTNIRVVVHPRREGDFGVFSIGGVGTPESNERHELAEANRIMAEVRRHVDSFSQVSIAYETETWCDKWDGPEAQGNTLGRWPNCCSEDQAEFYRAHAAESDEWFAAHGMNDLEFLSEFRDGHHQEV